MDEPHGHWLSVCWEILTAIVLNCFEQYWISPGGSIPQSSSCTDTYHPPPAKIIHIRRARHAVYSWRSKGEVISNALLRIPSYGRAVVGRPARNFLQQLSTDTGCRMEDLLRALDDRDEWWERFREIRASSTPWWWWFYYAFLYILTMLGLVKWILNSQWI